MVSNQQFRLKWNNHRNTVLQEFETLLHNNSFVDCTIGADGKYLKAHKIVLSACSPYLQNVFSEHFDKHPVILLKDVSFKELKCMIDYMYCGEVNISECELPSFLRTAQSLKIKGLAEDINEYDSGSDNEHQEINSLSENGRTVEPSVEIHDDEAPPIKRSAPSLIYSNFAGRKRKSPNVISAGGKSSNNGEKVAQAPTSKLTGGNVPSCADTDNSDSTVCTTSKDNNVNKDENNDNKKTNSQDDPQEHKNRTEVKEEPVDADDDNSSYEFVNNPCDDSDPLNEDSESNCANSGKNFNEVSIANVSSCNEGEANDDDDYATSTTKIKEELISEVVTIPMDAEERKLRVRSSSELMSPQTSPSTSAIGAETAIYVVQPSANENEDEIIVKMDSLDEYINENDDYVDENPRETENVIEVMPYAMTTKSSPQPHQRSLPKSGPKLVRSERGECKMKYTDRAKQRRLSNRGRKSAANGKGHFRKILPAPSKPAAILPASLLPVSLATTATSYSAASTRATVQPASSASVTSDRAPSAYRMIAAAPPQNVKRVLRSATVKKEVPQIRPAIVASPAKRDAPETGNAIGAQPILLFNPTTGVVLLNSDAKSGPICTLPKLAGAVSTTKGSKMRQVACTQAASKNTKEVEKSPAVAPVATKFRKIAPHPIFETPKMMLPCKKCCALFADEDQLKVHARGCAETLRKPR